MASGALGLLRKKDSRLMAWDAAEGACNDIWDEFEKKFDELLAKKSQGITDGDVINRLEECKETFKRQLKSWRERGIGKLKEMLLKKRRGKRRVKSICSRHPMAVTAKTKKRGRPAKRVNRFKRKHRKTGQKKGWNNTKYAGRHRAGRHMSEKEAKRNAARRKKERKLDQRAGKVVRSARWSKRFKRYWKPYPKRLSLKLP